MDNWSALKNWKADVIEQLHGDIVLQVARGPKPGLSAKGECNAVAVSVRVGSQLPLPFWLTYYRPGCVTPSLSIGYYKGSVGPDGAAAPEVIDLEEGVKKTHANELQAMWDNLYDPEPQTLTGSDGGKISIEPPPKPDPKPKPGARTTLGKPKPMSISKYIQTVVGSVILRSIYIYIYLYYHNNTDMVVCPAIDSPSPRHLCGDARFHICIMSSLV